MRSITWPICTALALVAANFIYQALVNQVWGQAFERSFFQMIAIGVAHWTWPR